MRGEDKEWGKSREEIEKRGSSRVIGQRCSANAASSLYSFFTYRPPFSPVCYPHASWFKPCSSHCCILALPFLLLDSPLPHSFSALFVLFHLLKFLIPAVSHLPSSSCIQCHLVSLRLTPLENEHQGWTPKGWRARELPQGLVLSFDLTMLCGCLVAGRGDCETL